VPSEEAALYDRQLRLWGSVAQARIRQCRVLIAPFQGGVAIETAKNLILAGVKEVILLDDGEVDGYSLTAGFVWREEDIGQKVSSSDDC
jgi:ubiquitin-like 1-activating enzyme E1 A